jgi:hypothetical protein
LQQVDCASNCDEYAECERDPLASKLHQQHCRSRDRNQDGGVRLNRNAVVEPIRKTWSVERPTAERDDARDEGVQA